MVLSLAKMNRILKVDSLSRLAVVEAGVRNLAISEAVQSQGLYYAPDPSSQIACSIGGNVAENSGGVHCLKYGLTTNNLLGLEVVLIDGEVEVTAVRLQRPLGQHPTGLLDRPPVDLDDQLGRRCRGHELL